ncbi:MAG: six-cysteine ranthipeptide SCIFF [Oscillospiraceae bacterium]|nr:six-cysteine ranthipeptide SCIFF [Oscillospiraceae bacterium]
MNKPFIKTINGTDFKKNVVTKGCGECGSSCQSACKTSCTVANQKCKQAKK